MKMKNRPNGGLQLTYTACLLYVFAGKIGIIFGIMFVS